METLEEITGAVRDGATVRRVFGDPYQVDGLTVIPVARVGGGGGGGSGDGPEGQGGGHGGGFGVGATPVGAFVVKDGDVRYVPTVDVTALATRGAAVAVTLLVTWRSVAKARQRRKTRTAKYRD